MSRPCSICTSKILLRINTARFVEHLSYARIAARFKLADGTVKRHFAHTSPPAEPVQVGGEDSRALATVAPPSPPSLGRSCVVCPSEHRQDIERGLVANTPIAAMEKRFRLSTEAIERHASQCIPEMLERARAFSTAKTASEGIAELFAETREFLNEAKAAREYLAWAAALRGLERNFNLLAKLTGEMRGPDPEDAFLRSSTWRDILQAHDRALAPYPDAAAALKAELAAVFA